MAELKPQITEIALPDQSDQSEPSATAQLFEIYDDDGPYAPRTEESIEVAPPDEAADAEATEASEASDAPGQLLTPEETPEPSVTCGRPTPTISPF